ncbi:hypothetical protein [Marinobacterium marinum]|uniref:Transmembrane protein n=1 Tax=Marinobacterium marinum TaxID=2756129 RepID=A0A7W2AAJ5_9GAMM|nr:hypothetical protein [Marinobacterium marinum]MBA4501075.1 hypothetical protein [Marinobacterium marinum]
MSGNQRMFWLIWGMGLVPVLLAVLAWSSGIGVPAQGVNQGELVTPVRTLQAWGGEPEKYTGHWSLLLVHEDRCLGQCLTRLEQLKRVHDALGRESNRVRVDAVLTDALAPGVWVVDPLGNLVMKYPPGWESRALLGDMRRLLKASRLG